MFLREKAPTRHIPFLTGRTLSQLRPVRPTFKRVPLQPPAGLRLHYIIHYHMLFEFELFTFIHSILDVMVAIL